MNPYNKMNVVDKAISFISPSYAIKRLRSRMALEVLGGYTGASKSRRSLKEWSPMGNDADSDILDDLPTLRERSRDLIRNNPLAAGAIKTKVSNVIGTGLKLQSRIDRAALGMTDAQADEWERTAEREWKMFWESKCCDLSRTMTGTDISRMVYQQAKENGDVFILLPKVKYPNDLYSLKLQVIEADRICNSGNAQDTETLAGGIEKNQYGAPKAYHILKTHPGSLLNDYKWQIRPAFGSKTGLRNVIHLFSPTRPGQSRGVPDLAAVIEPLKQLGRYTEAEMMSAVISGMFTVFIETETGAGDFDYSNFKNESGQQSGDKDLKLGNGLIMELAAGEKIHDSNPGRPNTAFDPFVQSILRQIGTALELPFEILIKHFTASYSAARAALLELWKYVMSERRWFTDNFLKVVYEVWMYEAVSSGRLVAPGYLADPSIRTFYLGCEFIGPAKGQIDELKEVKASKERLANGLSCLSDEIAHLSGRDWERIHIQQAKEKKKRIEDGLEIPEPVATPVNPTSVPPANADNNQQQGQVNNGN